MRIAITANGDGPDSLADGRYWAARYILIFSPTDGLWETVPLPQPTRRAKAYGKAIADLLAEKGVTALISGGIDPVSFKELGKRDIRIYEAPACDARKAAAMLAAGRLAELRLPDAIAIFRKRKGIKP